MTMFFAAVGASATAYVDLPTSLACLAFIALQLTSHVLVSLLLGAALRLPRRILLLASNANVGGPATAAAMATARHWGDLVVPGLLLGTLGYTMGTGIALLLVKWYLMPGTIGG